jgi:orotate phosphoribosyltransferase
MLDAPQFIALAKGRRGHFRLESGHHAVLWLDLDGLFLNARRIAPFVDRLTDLIRRYRVDIVCGPLLGGAFLAQLVARALSVDFCFTERELPTGADGMYRARYRLPPAFIGSVEGRRVAIVDDVMSAGSALRGTYLELASYEAHTVVAGALMSMGPLGLRYFSDNGVPVAAVVHQEAMLWRPEECPQCKAGEPLEDVVGLAPVEGFRPTKRWITPS